jgi:cystathionine beta-lyase/cystathionine gamma-synthase
VEVRGDFRAAEKLIGALSLGANAASLGGYETLVVHPAAMWGRQLTSEQRAAMSIGDNLVRVSVGLEDEVDLLKDFAQALDGIQD